MLSIFLGSLDFVFVKEKNIMTTWTLLNVQIQHLTVGCLGQLSYCPWCHPLRLYHELFSISRVLHHQQMCLTCWLVDSNSDCWTRWLPIISNGCRCNWSLRCTSLSTFISLCLYYVRLHEENIRSNPYYNKLETGVILSNGCTVLIHLKLYK